MKIALLTLLICSTLVRADVPAVPDSLSPDGKLQVVMDVDRDSAISPEWKEESFPRIEVTERATGKVVASIGYFGAAGDDARPLREHVRVHWRSDAKAFAITINDRFYSSGKVLVLNKELQFVEVAFPSYTTMTGFPVPASGQLRPRGRSSVEGWDPQGRLIYSIFMSARPSYSGDDPLEHRVLLDVTAEGMVVVKKPGSKPGRPGQ
jgi:hypothetical protein